MLAIQFLPRAQSGATNNRHQLAVLAGSSRPSLAQRLAQCCSGGDAAGDAGVMGKGHSKSRRGVQPCDSWQRHNIMPPSESDKAAADRLRLEGNRMFQKEKYGAALEVKCR